MLFQTTPEHEALRAKIRAFAEEEIKPIAFLLDQQNEFPEDAVRKLGEMGLMGIPYPKEYGGAGLDILSYAIAVEELARVDGGSGGHPVGPCVPGFLAHLRLWHRGAEAEIPGPPGQGGEDRRLRPHRAQRRVRRRRTETTAVRKGDHYILNGGKIFITNAPQGGHLRGLCRDHPPTSAPGASAPSSWRKGWKGFYFGDHYDKMGIRSSTTAELIFDNVEVPAENLLGEEGQGFKIAMATLDGGRIGVAAQALGIAQGAYENALAYAKERVQFGKPVGLPAGGLLQTGGYGHQAPLRPLPGLLRRRAEGGPCPLWDGGRHGKDVCLRYRPGGHQRRLADPRRSGLHEGHGGGTGLPGRQDHHHLRGHQRDPAGGHCLPLAGQGPQEGGGSSSRPKKPAPVTGVRKQKIFRDGSPRSRWPPWWST